MIHIPKNLTDFEKKMYFVGLMFHLIFFATTFMSNPVYTPKERKERVKNGKADLFARTMWWIRDRLWDLRIAIWNVANEIASQFKEMGARNYELFWCTKEYRCEETVCESPKVPKVLIYKLTELNLDIHNYCHYSVKKIGYSDCATSDLTIESLLPKANQDSLIVYRIKGMYKACKQKAKGLLQKGRLT
jgi:hypothetical protein